MSGTGLLPPKGAEYSQGYGTGLLPPANIASKYPLIPKTTGHKKNTDVLQSMSNLSMRLMGLPNASKPTQRPLGVNLGPNIFGRGGRRRSARKSRKTRKSKTRRSRK